VVYRDHGPGRASSRSFTTKIAEIDNAGTPSEKEEPIGNDSGFLWRLNSYWRYLQVGGDVRVDLQSLSLSREVPFILRPATRPVISRIARESLTQTLEALRRHLAGPNGAGSAS